jgi:hypothetical protein
MRVYLNLLLFLSFCKVFSQEIPNFNAVDSLYREDQFYVGMTYGTLQKRPADISQDKFAPSISFGFLRDMPINKKRTVAIAMGLGYAINNYNQNLLITEKEGKVQYQPIESNAKYSKNKLNLQYLELPVEFRWRNSTPESHIFWRVYTGFKFSYLTYDRSKYKEGQNEIRVKNNKDVNPLQYGPYMCIGRNTWNFYAYYSLTPIFKTAEINNSKIEMNTLAMGLHFYIL